VEVHATAVTASQSMRAYSGHLLHLLCALPSGSIVRFILVFFPAVRLLCNH